MSDTISLTVTLAIRATPDQIWDALTDGARTPDYYYGFEAHYGDVAPGTPYSYTVGGGTVINGAVLAAEPGRSLQATFNGQWDPSIAELPESVVTFTLSDPAMPMPGVTILSCVHENLPDTVAAHHLEIGWVSILSGLKTVLETGAPMSALAS